MKNIEANISGQKETSNQLANPLHNKYVIVYNKTLPVSSFENKAQAYNVLIAIFAPEDHKSYISAKEKGYTIMERDTLLNEYKEYLTKNYRSY